MHAITKHQEKLIGGLIKNGRFANKSEVVRAGLRLLEEHERDTAGPDGYAPGVKKEEKKPRKDLAATGQRLRDEARRSMSRKEGNTLLKKVLQDIEAE